VNYEEVDGGSIDDPYVYGEKKIAMKMNINVADLHGKFIFTG